MNRDFLYGLLVLLWSTLACQPVIAIGGNELLFLLIITALLLGPPIYRLVRRMEEFLKRRRPQK